MNQSELIRKLNVMMSIEDVIVGSGYDYGRDECALNELFNNTIDYFNKDGMLTDDLANEWCMDANERYYLLYGNMDDLRTYYKNH